MKPTDLAIRLTTFLTDYLAAQRNVSPNTIKAYRDTFALLLRYCRDVRAIPPEKLYIVHLDADLVRAFLQYLEKERRCGASTVNNRLAALHSFFRYLQIEEPEKLLHCQRILAVPFRRHARPAVGYLSADKLSVLLKQPALQTRQGRRDAVLLSVLYDTGVRVQELSDLTGQDLRLETPPHVRVCGKGRKMRAIPLMEKTVRLLKEYLRERQLDRPERRREPLFQNRAGAQLSRSGIRYILSKYTVRARAVDHNFPDKISPHTLRHTKAMHLRHTKAMHLLQSGNPLMIIRDVLGHKDISTTDIYARADMEMKREALNKAEGLSAAPTMPSWKKNKELLEWLRAL